MLAGFPASWAENGAKIPASVLSSQHFVSLTNVTAFKGAEQLKEIYTVNHFCAETTEEGLSGADKHRRLCAVAAKN